MPLLLYAGVVLVILGSIVYLRFSRRGHLPPGPPPKLWSGNVHQLPTGEPWLTYARWSQTYGPLVFYRVYSRKALVLNSFKSALDLLESSRSSIYSDRPMAWMYKELIGRKLAVFNISVKHPRFKKYRKLLQTGLNPRATQSYRTTQEAQARILVQGLATAPEQFIYQIRRYAGGVILEVTYGWTVSKKNDFFVSLMEKALVTHANITKPGRWWVDSYPILGFVPAWFPFAEFKREAAATFRGLFSNVESTPHEWAKKQMESGHYVESFTSIHMRPESGVPPDTEEEDIIKWCSSALYAGGADTVVGVLTGFILQMVLCPEVQKRAQSELDRIVGNRLPNIDDLSNLSFVSALLKEVLRWASVSPLGLPHRLTKDDTYSGYFIPKDTTVYANNWYFPNGIPRALCFRPGSLHPKEDVEPQLDPRRYVFGFGRRVCPGAHFAEVTAFLAITYILSVFNISEALDEHGEEIEPKIEFTTAVTSHVKPFECRIAVRNLDLLAAAADKTDDSSQGSHR
ncbi:cytochrome P450 [Fomitopsis serialis]|uniref:cytochrome P450 n=1 Tax=Fomitopsis serialis TaxID=139415 RepID=UPI002007BA7B|nr:cytochrome P450 [Neoantrodia serialis]KAH9933809.1 cytochrome P450 [Neoantrodia serialis]